MYGREAGELSGDWLGYFWRGYRCLCRGPVGVLVYAGRVGEKIEKDGNKEKEKEIYYGVGRVGGKRAWARPISLSLAKAHGNTVLQAWQDACTHCSRTL